MAYADRCRKAPADIAVAVVLPVVAVAPAVRRGAELEPAKCGNEIDLRVALTLAPLSMGDVGGVRRQVSHHVRSTYGADRIARTWAYGQVIFPALDRVSPGFSHTMKPEIRRVALAGLREFVGLEALRDWAVQAGARDVLRSELPDIYVTKRASAPQGTR